MRGPGWVTLVCWIGEATFPKLWHQIHPLHTHTHTLCSPYSIMHLHILLLKITAFDLNHLSFPLMQQNIIQSHSFDPAVDYVTNLLYSSVPIFLSISSSFISAKHMGASGELTAAMYFPTTIYYRLVLPRNISTHPNPEAVHLDDVVSTVYRLPLKESAFLILMMYLLKGFTMNYVSCGDQIFFRQNSQCRKKKLSLCNTLKQKCFADHVRAAHIY